MRILIANEISNRTELIEPPPRKNPVKIGSRADCDVRLQSGAVPADAAQVVNHGKGQGWQLETLCAQIHHHDQPLKAGASLTLTEENVVYLYPFWITIFLDREDREGSLSSTLSQLDMQYVELVQQLHQSLSKSFQNNSANGYSVEHESDSESFLFQLERAIETGAAADPSFPSDDLQPSALCDHMAGIFCRSQALSLLATGSQTGIRKHSPWARIRTSRPDHDQEIERLIPRLLRSLSLMGTTDTADPTQKIRKLDSDFWPLWHGNVNKLNLDLRRYLALSQLKKDIKENWFGLGPLEDLLEDPSVTEIMVNDAEQIFVEKHGTIEETGRRFLRDLKDVIDRIVGPIDRTINTSTPLVDARLSDGSRVNAVIAPLVIGGPSLTIRRFPKKPIDWEFLISRGSLTLGAKEFLAAAVQYRANILVAGGTASGKTTLLNALSLFIKDRERIVTIEDTAELRMLNRHVVRLESRPKNMEGTGEIPIRMLVKNALRMRPDRIIVGECRGGEALDMLQAMNTGHDGSMTTVHANTPRDVISRLEVMVQQGDGAGLPIAAIHRQIASAINLIVQLAAEPLPGGKRKRVVREISELVGIDNEGQIIIRPIFRRREHGELRPTGSLPTFIAELISHDFNLDHLKRWES